MCFFSMLAKALFVFVRSVANFTEDRRLVHVLRLKMSVDVKFVGAGLATEATLPRGSDRVPDIVCQEEIIKLFMCQFNNRT